MPSSFDQLDFVLLLLSKICDEVTIGLAATADAAHEANGDTILLGDITSKQFFYVKGMGDADHLVYRELAKAPLAIFMARKALANLESLLFLAKQLGSPRSCRLLDLC